MIDELNDFGFTAVYEEELDAVREAKEQFDVAIEQIKTVDNRAKKLYDAILPLLNNLKKNPEKDYILWPNRNSRIEAFEEKLANIMNGE
jgi:hypothetical protein|tara:strand:- start:2506 stop:2772 length:267 start_codon:yes stop_codon:yes gene_type:complete